MEAKRVVAGEKPNSQAELFDGLSYELNEDAGGLFDFGRGCAPVRACALPPATRRNVAACVLARSKSRIAIRRPRTLEKNDFSDNLLRCRPEEFAKRPAATST